MQAQRKPRIERNLLEWFESIGEIKGTSLTIPPHIEQLPCCGAVVEDRDHPHVLVWSKGGWTHSTCGKAVPDLPKTVPSCFEEGSWKYGLLHARHPRETGNWAGGRSWPIL